MSKAPIQQCSGVRGSRGGLQVRLVLAVGLAMTMAAGCDAPPAKGPNPARNDAAAGTGGRGGGGGSSSSGTGGSIAAGGSGGSVAAGGTGGSVATGGTGGTGGSAGNAGMTGGTGGTGGATGGTGGSAGSTGGTGGSTGGTDGGMADTQLPVDLAPDQQVDTLPPDMAPAPRCGDGKMDPGEQCDQGAANAANAYGPGKCTATCRTAPFCGDDTRSNGEVCDNGTMNSDTAYGPNACTKACTRAPFCGDRMKAPNEECDEGPGGKPATMGVAGCSTQCRILPALPVMMCNNGMKEGTEACDNPGGNLDVAEYVRMAPPVRGDRLPQCNRMCRVIRFCGDGTQDTRDGEECDMGGGNRDTGTCTSQCKDARCGDGIKQDHEECDNGMKNVSVAYSATPPPAGDPRFCRATGAGSASCKPVPFCGDGATQAGNGEQCDDGADNGKPGKCTAMCKTPAVPVAKKIKVASVTPAGCNAACLNDINTSGGDVLIGCTPSAPPMGPPDFRLAGDTSLTFAALGGTPGLNTRLSLFIDGGGSYQVSCDRASGGTFQLVDNQPTQDIPVECAQRSAGIKINVHNNGTGTAMAPSCLRLRFAEIDATVTP
jgi:hypothetical protein